MSPAGRIGFAVLGAVAGGAIGGGVGLLGGLAYVELARVSSMEGHSGYVIVFWMLIGILLGFVAGIFVGLRLAR